MNLGNNSTATIEFSSTDAKNNFADLLEQVVKGHLVAVTRYKQRKMACISWEEYVRLTKPAEGSLEKLTEEFDALRSRIRSKETAKAVQNLMAAKEEDFADTEQN